MACLPTRPLGPRQRAGQPLILRSVASRFRIRAGHEIIPRAMSGGSGRDTKHDQGRRRPFRGIEPGRPVVVSRVIGRAGSRPRQDPGRPCSTVLAFEVPARRGRCGILGQTSLSSVLGVQAGRSAPPRKAPRIRVLAVPGRPPAAGRSRAARANRSARRARPAPADQVAQTLPLPIELQFHPQDGLAELGMGLGGAAENQRLIAPGQTVLVIAGVQAKADQGGSNAARAVRTIAAS